MLCFLFDNSKLTAFLREGWEGERGDTKRRPTRGPAVSYVGWGRGDYLMSFPVSSWRKLVAEPDLFSGL